METLIEKKTKKKIEKKTKKTIRLYNPGALDFNERHRIKAIEATEEYTRIDFIYKSSKIYENGGWIQMHEDSFIRPFNSEVKYKLVKAIGIPIAPVKHFFKKKGEYFTYTLLFPALPVSTTKIDIIEMEAPGNYFNFYGVDYSRWMTVPHPTDIPYSNN